MIIVSFSSELRLAGNGEDECRLKKARIAGVLGRDVELPEADVPDATEKGGSGGARREGSEVDWSGTKGERDCDDSERNDVVDAMELKLSL